MGAAIYFWRGIILYVGALPELPLHAHVAAAWIAGLDGEIEVRGPAAGGWRRARTAFLPSSFEHAVRIPDGGRFATLLAEPGTELCLRLGLESSGEQNPAPPAAPLFDPPGGARLIRLAAELDAARQPAVEEALLEAFLGEFSRRRPLDPRLDDVVAAILRAGDEALPVEALAASIGMSTSWLLHAFKSQLETPLRRFRTYFRLKATALYLKRGESLAGAAINAGFYDQAHFTNAFRQTFGLSPGLVFQHPERMRWRVDEETWTEQTLRSLAPAS